jgi:hypothetical protein
VPSFLGGLTGEKGASPAAGADTWTNCPGTKVKPRAASSSVSRNLNSVVSPEIGFNETISAWEGMFVIWSTGISWLHGPLSAVKQPLLLLEEFQKVNFHWADLSAAPAADAGDDPPERPKAEVFVEKAVAESLLSSFSEAIAAGDFAVGFEKAVIPFPLPFGVPSVKVAVFPDVEAVACWATE